MKAIRLSLLAWSLAAGSHAAFAKAPSPGLAAARPIGSPGSWIGSEDYPAIALRHDMTGVTAFRLTVGPTGKPSRCEIVESSGFDILDKATCERVMAKAQFTPARGRAGKPVEGTYVNRVRWVTPVGERPAESEHFMSMLLSIDRTGTVTSCRMVIHVPIAPAAGSAEKPCGPAIETPPPAFGLELRGNFQGPSAEVEIREADVFTPDLRARVLTPMPDYEQRGLNVFRFTVVKNGKLGQCSYEEQRGSDHLVTDYCGEARRKTFDPPFSAFDSNGVATGWHIVRVLLKSPQ